MPLVDTLVLYGIKPMKVRPSAASVASRPIRLRPAIRRHRRSVQPRAGQLLHSEWPEPTETVDLISFIGQFLTDSGTTLGAEDEDGFPFRLLHFRRTFVEKMFAIHSKVELLKHDGQPLGSYARHYYDLYQLSQQSAVLAMLHSAEYA